MYRFLIKLVATFFFVGYLPFAPGTFGSMAGLGLFLLLRENFNLLIGVTVLIMFLGFALSKKAARIFNRRDPGQIVIDEVAGIFLCFLGISTNSVILSVGFIIFRLLDLLKPYPANIFQRQDTSVGIMGDDIIAGIYTNLILRILLVFF